MEIRCKAVEKAETLVVVDLNAQLSRNQFAQGLTDFDGQTSTAKQRLGGDNKG